MSRFFTPRVHLALASVLVFVTALATGCTYSHGEPQGPCGDTVDATYRTVVAPIFAAHCWECHSASQANIKGGGNNLGDYNAIKNYPQGPDRILNCIKHNPGFIEMPQGEPKLSDCDIARIQSWIQAGQLDN